jgi:hypothetical protein
MEYSCMKTIGNINLFKSTKRSDAKNNKKENKE